MSLSHEEIEDYVNQRTMLQLVWGVEAEQNELRTCPQCFAEVKESWKSRHDVWHTLSRPVGGMVPLDMIFTS